MKKFKMRALFLAVTTAGLLAAGSANAGLFTLTDDNSTAQIRTTVNPQMPNDPVGMFSWNIDGVNHLFQQWFWYRVGAGPEASIDTLPIDFEGETDTNFDGEFDTLFTRYLGNGFEIEIRYALDGGPPGSNLSDIAEQITITNTGGVALDFHFFQYADFDLDGDAGDDSGAFTNPNTVLQTDDVLALTETVITPAANQRAMEAYPNILLSLNDGNPTNLSSLGQGPLTFEDVSWGFQWDITIGVNGAFQISKDKNMRIQLPEPASLALLGLGLAALGLRRRRRFK